MFEEMYDKSQFGSSVPIFLLILLNFCFQWTSREYMGDDNPHKGHIENLSY